MNETRWHRFRRWLSASRPGVDFGAFNTDDALRASLRELDRTWYRVLAIYDLRPGRSAPAMSEEEWLRRYAA